MDSRVTSRPAKWTLPESGCRAPETCWMKVVLPAPLGPIKACTSPAATAKSTSFKASTAAKRRDRRRTSSRGSVMPPPEQRSDAAGGEEHDTEQEQAEHDMPVRGEADQGFFQQEQDSRAHHAAVEVADAADDDHDQQGAGQPGKGTAQRESQLAIAEDRVA